MTLNKKDLTILAGETLAWAAKIECVKLEDNEHLYFTIRDWCIHFGHSSYIFKKVKQTMIANGMAIAQQVGKGHYISNDPRDISTHSDLNIKNLLTRHRTFIEEFNSIQMSKYSEEVITELKEIAKLRFDDKGVLTFPRKMLLEGITKAQIQ